MVNHAYYTYQDPDGPNLQYSERSEDENEGVIESMEKKQQELQLRRREEERMKQAERVKSNKQKQMSLNRGKIVAVEPARPTQRRPKQIA